jgi:hypothetical protein
MSDNQCERCKGHLIEIDHYGELESEIEDNGLRLLKGGVMRRLCGCLAERGVSCSPFSRG